VINDEVRCLQARFLVSVGGGAVSFGVPSGLGSVGLSRLLQISRGMAIWIR
jgi:hypothetical protein